MKNLTNTLGIDLSSNNGDIDISAAKEAGFKWAMLRIGYGNDESDQDDTRIFDYAKQCKKCGLPFGVYLMSYALNEDYCKSEIAHTKRIMSELWDRGIEPDLPIVAIDIEPTDWSLCGIKRSEKWAGSPLRMLALMNMKNSTPLTAKIHISGGRNGIRNVSSPARMINLPCGNMVARPTTLATHMLRV